MDNNLTLDVFWIDFMPIYQHAIGVITTVLTAFVIYLMLTKTPEPGRGVMRHLMLTQITILIADICWGFVYCPVLLMPLSATFCAGIICGFEWGKHMGMVLLFQCSFQVTFAIILTIQYKYSVIAKMTNHRKITPISVFAAFEIPMAGMIVCGIFQQDLFEYLAEKRQLAIIKLTQNGNNLSGIAYDWSRFPWALPFFATLDLACLIGYLGGGAYYVVRIYQMLSRKLFIPLIVQAGPMVMYILSANLLWFTPGTMNTVLCVQLCHSIVHTGIQIFTTPSYRASLRIRSYNKAISVTTKTSKY